MAKRENRRKGRINNERREVMRGLGRERGLGMKGEEEEEGKKKQEKERTRKKSRRGTRQGETRKGDE